MTHLNLIQSSKSVFRRLHFACGFNNSDTFLAYLPMSHIFEMMCELTFYLAGVRIAYGRASTMYVLMN